MGQFLSPTYSHLSPTHINISQWDQRRDMLLAAKKDDTQFSPAPRKSANTQIFITAYTAVGWLRCLRCQQQFRGSQTHSRFEDIQWTAKESSFLPTASQLATCDLIFYIGIVKPSPLVIGIFLGIISHFLIYMSLELSFVIDRMSCWACGDSAEFCTQLLYK